MAENLIKKISLPGVTVPYDLDALYFAGQSEAEWKLYIEEKAEGGFEVVIRDTLPTIPETGKDEFYKEWRNKLVFVPASTTAEKNIKKEYVLIRTGAEGAYNYAWELLGDTSVDISSKVDKGTYTTEAPNTNATGEGGAQTITSGEGGAQTALGTATVSYDKANAATGESGAATINSSSVSAGTVDFSNASAAFNGKTATLAATVTGASIEDHVYKPEGTISGSQAIAAHSHGVNAATASVSVITTVTHTDDTFTANGDDSWNAGSLPSFTQGSKATLSTTSYADVCQSPTVDASGILSWSAASIAGVNGFTPNGNDSWNAGALPSFTQGSKASFVKGTFSASVAPITFVTGITLNDGGAVTVNGSNFAFAGKTATLEHDFNAGNISMNYVPEGTIGVSGTQALAAHNHSVSVANHTHSISYTATQVNGSVAVAVSDHTHEVVVANHTHTLNNHTHNIDLE